MRAVRVGIIGVGNCAASLVEGVEFYRRTGDTAGLMHSGTIGGYAVSDITVSAAFDVSDAKVGKDVSLALRTEPNNAARMVEHLEPTGQAVLAAPVLDGLGPKGRERVKASHLVGDAYSDTILDHLKYTDTEVLVNFLPVGSEEATRYWADMALKAGCAFLNAIPVSIARDPEWRTRYAREGLPLIGDDVKSQLGATIVHRVLAELWSNRGMELENTYQLNVGGNMDFYNMLDRDRLASKRVSKSSSVQSVANRGKGLPEGNLHIGPSDYVPWLTDRKLAFIRMEGRAFGGVPINMEMRMEVWDSPNSAGVVVDCVRYLKAAMDAGVSGVLEYPAAWTMKAPPFFHSDAEAMRKANEEFGEA